MRKLKHALLGAALLVSLFAVAPSASLAAFADAWAAIDRGSISMVFNGEAVPIQGYIIDAYAQAGDNSAQAMGWILEAIAQEDPGQYWGWSGADETDLYTAAYVEGSGDFSGLAYGEALWNGLYTAPQEGTLSISFDYYLWYEVSSEVGEMTYAYADPGVSLTIGDQSVSSDPFFFGEAFNGMSFDVDMPGNLSLIYDLAAGETVDFEALVSSQSEISAVPVPAAVWLLGSGLLGLCGIRKRFNQ